MDIKIHKKKNKNIAEFVGTERLSSVDDFLDIIGNANYMGANKTIIRKQNLPAEFFDLKTRFAGEILQKFSTYRQQLAIVGDFSEFTSKSLHDFIRESNRGNQILFVGTIEEAFEKL